MRILLDQAICSLRNKGNVALLQAAVTRLSQLWHTASLEALTEAPHLLKLYCPITHPVSVYPWKDWSGKHEQMDRFHRLMPRPILSSFLEIREEIASHRSNRAGQSQPLSPDSSQVSDSVPAADLDGIKNNHDFLQALRGADLMIATGGGYMCDSDKPYLLRVLSRLEMAIELGKPVAMVGQGIGPLEDAELRSRLQAILPSVGLMLVRERRVAFPLLDALGVPADRVMMTGDDAIEMAYAARTPRLGTAIGVNLRLARYTQVGQAYIQKIRALLRETGRQYKAQLIALPISRDIREPDHQVIRQLLMGCDNVSMDWRRFETPLAIIKKIGSCRLVVTGAFHPAVFALAQGIPVVGLVKSVEYQNKFLGLRDEFGADCQIIHLDDEQMEEKLLAAIAIAWQSAEKSRPALWQAAVRQIELGQIGYQRLCNLVNQA